MGPPGRCPRLRGVFNNNANPTFPKACPTPKTSRRPWRWRRWCAQRAQCPPPSQSSAASAALVRGARGQGDPEAKGEASLRSTGGANSAPLRRQWPCAAGTCQKPLNDPQQACSGRSWNASPRPAPPPCAKCPAATCRWWCPSRRTAPPPSAPPCCWPRVRASVSLSLEASAACTGGRECTRSAQRQSVRRAAGGR
jgi:hypothetical protein